MGLPNVLLHCGNRTSNELENLFDVVCCDMVEDVLHGARGSQLIKIIRAVLADELLEDRKQGRRVSLHDNLEGL